MIITGIGPENAVLLLFLQRSSVGVGRWNGIPVLHWNYCTLELEGVRITGPSCYTRRSRNLKSMKPLQKVVALCHRVLLPKPAA
jgi:hypothetical protein